MQSIADYEFVRPLGRGSRFYLARRPARLPVEAEYVAVKVLSGASTSDAWSRAIREMTAFASVRSPYLVTVYDAGQHEGTFYYSTEYLPAGSLGDPAELVDPGRALRAVADAARAAAALHAVGIAHRDIKPHNILLTPTGAKLSDLGLSQDFTAAGLTGMGSTTSVEYTDPDLLRGEPPGPHNDVWSLGATLHRVGRGTGVYGDLPADVLLAVRRILSSGPEVSPSLAGPVAELVRACLVPAPYRPSAAELADRLAGVAD